MTQIIIDIKAVRVNQNIIKFEAISNSGQIVRSEINLSEFPNYNTFAQWLLNQPVTETINDNFRKRLTIDFHTDNGLRILDNVNVENLPEEKYLGDIDNIPNWATWTREQAVSWIETNVTNLATAKTAISALAEMTILLRDIVRGLQRNNE